MQWVVHHSLCSRQEAVPAVTETSKEKEMHSNKMKEGLKRRGFLFHTTFDSKYARQRNSYIQVHLRIRVNILALCTI